MSVGMDVDMGMSTGLNVTASARMEMHHGPTMWMGHLVATVATAWLLARGEAWLWSWADRAVAAAAFAPSAAAVTTHPGTHQVRFAVHGRPELDHASPRGPPVLLAV